MTISKPQFEGPEVGRSHKDIIARAGQELVGAGFGELVKTLAGACCLPLGV